jgi:hypothetical protein
MKLRLLLNLPREHGAWAMFYIPFLIGILVGKVINFQVLLLLIAATALFISRESLLVVWRSKARNRLNGKALCLLVGYVVIAISGGAILVFQYGFWLLLVTGIPGLLLLMFNGHQSSKREDRTFLTETLAICGLTLSAPAAHYVGSGSWGATTWWLWVCSILYFTSSVFYVKFRVALHHGKSPDYRKLVARASLLYHLTLAALFLTLITIGILRFWVIPAYLPVIARSVVHNFSPPTSLDLRKIGMTEMGYSILFLIFTVLTFW